jgi:DNA polymerase elongation subunit (family B)
MTYINQIIKSSISLDVEYANDIYDDFSKFPISNNSSCLFMIGISDYKKKYINFTASKLDSSNEELVLQNYFNYIHEIISKNGKLVIFHWSFADKNVIEKALLRHPSLNNFYKKNILNNIIYIDLLKVVKSTIQLKSYSLKYVLEKLLDIKYDTNCKNGFDAMCSIIYNDIEIRNNNNKKLVDFETTNDIILYNRLDTVYLYDIIKIFTTLNKY